LVGALFGGAGGLAIVATVIVVGWLSHYLHAHIESICLVVPVSTWARLWLSDVFGGLLGLAGASELARCVADVIAVEFGFFSLINESVSGCRG